MSIPFYLVAQAGHDENGNTSGGLVGDQGATELFASKLSSVNFTDVYRAKDEQTAEKIAMFMEKAIINGFIGYNQNKNERDTLLTVLEGNGFNVDKIGVPCSCDCSSLVYCAVLNATGNHHTPADDAGTIAPRTSEYNHYLTVECGEFEHIPNAAQTIAPASLKRGDILWRSGHVGVWI